MTEKYARSLCPRLDAALYSELRASRIRRGTESPRLVTEPNPLAPKRRSALARSMRTAAAIIALAVTSCVLAGTPGPVQSEPRVSSAMIESIVRSSGLEDSAEISRRVGCLEQELRSVIERFGQGRPSYGKARRVLRFLHDQYLKEYDDKADDLWSVVESGKFNCLSATFFYALVASGLGYGPQVLETPGHLLVRLSVGGRPIDVETTLARGFDLEGALPSERLLQEADRVGYLHASVPNHTLRSFSLETAVGFCWLNTAWRAIERGQGSQAVHAAMIARELLPDPLAHSDGISRLLIQAFRLEYEAGRFDSAYRIALIDVDSTGSPTTSRDRLLAAALKRIEAACGADDPAAAEAILEELARGPLPGPDLARLEIRASPLIASSAVRMGDWTMARRAAERYDRVEPDREEAARLRAWIHLRSRSGGGASSAGPDPLLGSRFLHELD